MGAGYPGFSFGCYTEAVEGAFFGMIMVMGYKVLRYLGNMGIGVFHLIVGVVVLDVLPTPVARSVRRRSYCACACV